MYLLSFNITRPNWFEELQWEYRLERLYLKSKFAMIFKLFILKTMLIILLTSSIFCIRKHSIEPEDQMNEKNISGQIFEVTSSSQRPYANSSFSVYYHDDSLHITTDNDGKFTLSIPQYVDQIQIFIFKEGFAPLDSSITIDQASDVMFYIYQFINYFPLQIGNTWHYRVSYSKSRTYNYYHKSGEEAWEITDYDSMTQIGIIKCFFSGMVRQIDTRDNSGDTTFVDNVTSWYNFNITDNTVQFSTAGVTDTAISVFQNLVRLFNDSKIKVYYPLSMPDTVYSKTGLPNDFREYRQIKNIGLYYFRDWWTLIFGGDGVSYQLVDYSISKVNN